MMGVGHFNGHTGKLDSMILGMLLPAEGATAMDAVGCLLDTVLSMSLSDMVINASSIVGPAMEGLTSPTVANLTAALADIAASLLSDTIGVARLPGISRGSLRKLANDAIEGAMKGTFDCLPYAPPPPLAQVAKEEQDVVDSYAAKGEDLEGFVDFTDSGLISLIAAGANEALSAAGTKAPYNESLLINQLIALAVNPSGH